MTRQQWFWIWIEQTKMLNPFTLNIVEVTYFNNALKKGKQSASIFQKQRSNYKRNKNWGTPTQMHSCQWSWNHFVFSDMLLGWLLPFHYSFSQVKQMHAWHLFAAVKKRKKKKDCTPTWWARVYLHSSLLDAVFKALGGLQVLQTREQYHLVVVLTQLKPSLAHSHTNAGQTRVVC